MEAVQTCTMRIEAALGNEPAVQRFLTEALGTTECPPKARKGACAWRWRSCS